MGMEMGFHQSQSQELNQSQKLSLEQLLQMSQEMRHESFEFAERGIEGLKIADTFLKEKDLRGILIGGLAEEVWNPRHTKKDFEQHKDVDVLIPELPEGVEIGNFEKGIDWWLPKDMRLSVHYESGTTETTVRVWENAFGTRLAFGVDEPFAHTWPAGLHIPSSDFVIQMRKSETMARLDSRIAVDENIEGAFVEKLEKRIKTEIAPVIERELDYSDKVIVLRSFDRETVLAINSATSDSLIENQIYYRPEKPSAEFVDKEISRFESSEIEYGVTLNFDIHDNETGETLLAMHKKLTRTVLQIILERINHIDLSIIQPGLTSFLLAARKNFERETIKW